MTKILDWRLSEDQRDVVHLAVQALAEGHLVAFPTDTVYQVAASAMRPKAVERLVNLRPKSSLMPLEIALRSASEAEDYVPNMSLIAKRLAYRSWPGPVSIQLQNGNPFSLMSQLPEESRKSVVSPNGEITLRVPAHDAIMQVLHLSAGPMLLSSVISNTGGNATSVAQMVIDGITLVIDDGPSHFQNDATQVQVDGNVCHISRPGVLDAQALVSMTQMVILLVCTGNTCRSPMAQALLQSKLKKQFPSFFKPDGILPIVTCSAGISAMPGGTASPEAIDAMQDYGLELQGHQSSSVTARMLDRADIVLTMTDGHRQAILERWPKLVNKVKTLSPDGRDISDPFGGTLEVYKGCAQQIDRCLDAWVDKIDTNMLPNWQN